MEQDAIDELTAITRMYPEVIVQVLDKGFVRLIDYMGDDRAIVQAARVSYGAGSKGEESDRRLLSYLYTHDHGTPFEMVSFKFHVKAPLFIARQWMRHRVGSFNEISGRYVETVDEFYMPDAWRRQSASNRQASTDESIDKPSVADCAWAGAMKDAWYAYERLILLGVSREQARGVLPLATYTQFYWSVNLRSLLNFLRLRDSPEAQWEIQQYAQAIRQHITPIVPWTMEVIDARD